MLLHAAHPEGLTGGELVRELYGELDVHHPVTLRAELSRLRHLLGSRPYGLGTERVAVTEALGCCVN